MPAARPKTDILVIDVINDLKFPGGELVLPWMDRMADHLVPLCRRARRAGMPVIYVNDNFGNWRGTFKDLYRHCTRPASRARSIVRRLKPDKSDYFVLKPKHSAFFSTSLVPLLESLGTKRLILTGIATNLCVLFTAHDAHMRDYAITVVSDCCAAESDFDHNTAISQLKRFCDAKVCLGSEVDLKARKSTR